MCHLVLVGGLEVGQVDGHVAAQLQRLMVLPGALAVHARRFSLTKTSGYPEAKCDLSYEVNSINLLLASLLTTYLVNF
jgi:hypothetical protein